MNRQTLADATSLHDAAVPIYLMQEIANGTKASERDAEKTVDYLLNRLSKTNLIVKLKALQIISFCIREGDPVFADVLREEQGEITPYLQLSGPPDPVMGDERYRRIRVAAQEVMVCLNDGRLPRQNDPAPAGASGPWGAQSAAPQQPQYGAPQNAHGSAGGYQTSSSSKNSQPWGNAPSSSSGGRPAPYSDSPAPSGPSYGGHGGYGGPQGGYGGSSGGSGYGCDSSSHQSSHHSHQPSGLSSWSSPAPPQPPAHGAPKPAAGGMWSSSGYQKTVSSAPAYGGSSRDNRPTVLVGHSLNFPKPQSHGNSSLIGGVGSTSTGAFGNPLPTSGGSGYGGSGYGNSGGYSNSGGYGGPSGGMSHSSGGFGAVSSRQTPSYVENMNKMLSSNSSVNFSGGSYGVADNTAAAKLGKAVEGLKKIGVEAKDRWDRRNMDKSIGASLADHDELSAAAQVIDRGYYQPQVPQGTTGKDAPGEYERGLIDNLCASVGLARAPPADALKRFVDLAQTLDVQTIGDILLDKLEDSVWQVRLKALHVVLALLESPGAAPYMELFEDNAGVFEELRGDAKPTVVSKAVQVLRALGLLDESAPEPKRTTSRGSAGRSGSGHQQQSATGGEVDFLGFDSLSISGSTPGPHPAAQQPALNTYGSPPSSAPAVQQPPPPPAEVSLLDGFDAVPSYPTAPQYHQQQHNQPYHQPQQTHLLQSPRQQPQQHSLYGDLLVQTSQQIPPGQADDRSKTLSSFGKDLFTIANSPRASTNGDTSGATEQRSAFNFM